MATRPVTIEIQEEVAEAFVAATREERQDMQRMLGIYLQYLMGRSNQSLYEAMVEARKEAAANGLTQEILESLLDEPE